MTPTSDVESAQDQTTSSSSTADTSETQTEKSPRVPEKTPEKNRRNGRTNRAAAHPGVGTHESPDQYSVFADVDLSAIRHNVRTLMDRAAPSDLMAIVKADAYGHGAAHIAPVLEDEGVRAFAVARPAEGLELRDAGIRGRILVLGAPLPGDLPVCMEHGLDVTVSSEDIAQHVSTTQANPTAQFAFI